MYQSTDEGSQEGCDEGGKVMIKDDEGQARMRAGMTASKWEKDRKNCLTLSLAPLKGFFMEDMEDFTAED